MTTKTRREFVKQSAAGAVAMAALSLPKRTGALAFGKTINLGVIGCGGRWRSVAEIWANQEGLRIKYLCDVESRILADAATQVNVERSGLVDDMRRVLDDKSVDVVYVATPDHWHAPASILACEAGKHVYVEKPISHNVREGRLLVEAARRNNCVVQHGTQVRSTPTIMQGVKLLRDGIIGDVLVSKAWNVQRRGTIGRDKPSDPPATLNYDVWVGPAPMIPFQSNRYGGWHWWRHFGTGDMGNDGVHDIDYARWGLGAGGHPSKVSALGGKYFFDDDQEFPDTQQVAFEYRGKDGAKPRMLIYEQRLWSTNYPGNYNCDSGAEFYGTNGRMFLSRRGKIQVIGADNRPIEVAVPGVDQDTEAHIANFLECARTGAQPNADAEVGHLSSALSHLGNISTRLGRGFDFDGDKEQIAGDDEANALLKREYRSHWGTPKDA
jgi:predicted dehydrogenase